ncbi:ComEC/Rec2 family competence protein [Acetobacteraceae bacterium]|nr:ComEC/Rec2 family competence protein [Candidatus Parcubacteria bacterium]
MTHARRDLFLIFLFLGLFLLRVSFLIAGEGKADILRYADNTVVVEGQVVNDPERRETSLHANISVKTVDGEKTSGTVLAILPRATELSYGDTVEVRGKLQVPEAFETDTGRTFNYPGYLRAKGIVATMPYANIESSQQGPISLQRELFALKHTFEHSLERLLPEPDVSLLEGILLGERRGIPEDLNHAFIVSGLVHVVVLSGYNIAIVADTILRFLSAFLPKSVALGGGAFGIFLFAIMAGAGATTVRASIMGIIVILARYLNRPSAALRALGVAAAAMVLWNPLIVLHDPSFILSVLATFGLITLSPSVEKYLQFMPEKWGLRSIAASTIAVQLFVLPALLYMTGILSVVSLPANILALPTISFTMLAGFLAGLAGFIHPFFALPFTIVADLLLRYIMAIAQTATALPFSSAVIPPFPLWIAAIVYVPLTLFAIVRFRTDARSQTN